jgi:hypothetical protein
MVAFAISSCGSTSSTEAPPTQLIKQSELSHYKKGGVERVFLNYWSSLQFQDWPEVATYYDPKLRNFIGTATLIGAKKLNALSFPQLKPRIVKVNSTANNASVYYTLSLPDGTTEFNSALWRHGRGTWHLIYDSRLDSELSQLAQSRVELDKTGQAPVVSSTPSPQASRAANAAAQRQARFLQQQFKLTPP